MVQAARRRMAAGQGELGLGLVVPGTGHEAGHITLDVIELRGIHLTGPASSEACLCEGPISAT